jgi:signal transduction histidine kinase/ligand-binding sensor domain-containing protein
VLSLGLGLASNAGAALTISERTATTDQHRITYWTSEQGLPQNTVVSLLQSAEGYLWIGTRYGLARFDGVQMTDYSAELGGQDPDELDVRGLAEDKEGRLWVQTFAGLVCYQQGNFSRFPLNATPFPGPILSICGRSKGGLWLAYAGGVVEISQARMGRTLAVGRELPACSDAPAAIEVIFEDRKGNLWIRSRSLDRVCWSRYDDAARCVEPLTNIIKHPLTDIGAICPDRSGRLWLGRPGQLLCWADGRLTGHATPAAWGANQAQEIIEDTGGNIWIRTGAAVQLHRFEPRGNQFTSFDTSTGLLYCYDIRCLRADREENVWVGTGSGGLYRLQPRRLVSLLTGSTLTDDEVYSVAPGREGAVWLATSHGLVKYQAGQFAVYTNNSTLVQGNIGRVRPVFEHSSGAVYFCVDGAGMHTLREGTFCPVPCLDLGGADPRHVNSFVEDRSGTMWMASQHGLVERRGDECRLWSRTNGLSDERAFGLTCSPDGSVWVGTRSGGVNQFKDGCFRTFTTREGLLSNHAWPLRAEPDGTVWVGTPIGLNRIRGNQVRAVTTREGLFDNLAYCLIEDRRGNLWTFGNRGIWRVRGAELNAVVDGTAQRVYCVNYGEANGMASAEGNGDQQPNAAVLPSGELWFPTTRGVVILDPERLPENSVRPLVVVEEVLVNEETVFRDGALLPGKFVRNRAGEPLRLSPELNALEIRYTANTFTDPEKTRFRYRLDGEDERWHEADTRRLALYTKLHPGRYCFRVEACNPHGYWSAVATELPFELEPFFYQTWSFYGLCGVAAMAAVGGFHALRLRSLRHEEHLRQARMVLEERSRIAKDLHDDLGANLTGVALQLEIATRELEQPALLRQRLQGAVDSIRTLIDAMRGVVWSLNPRCDTLESFCAYFCEYAENFLTAAGLRCRLDFPEEVPARMLSAEARHHLLLALKESLNNVARHAAATEVRIGLSLQRSGLTLTIADDGRGFVPGSPASALDGGNPGRSAGTGLANMRRRVESLGGTFKLVSTAGAGTTITIQVPLPAATS